MSTVKSLHDEAMKLAQKALLARTKADSNDAIKFAKEAYILERDAANLIPLSESSEPTRSILYRSAASLALQAEEFNEATRLASSGLAGYPTPEIRNELKHLITNIEYSEYLQNRDLVLEEDDIQMTFKGNAIGVGIIPYDYFNGRMETTTTLIDRITQRKTGRIYQGGGRIASENKPFIPAMVAAKEGSFIITLRLLKAKKVTLPAFVNPAQIFAEIIKGIELINNENYEELHSLIGDDKYFENFVVAVKELAPDETNINFVGFSTKTQNISIERPRKSIQEYIHSNLKRKTIHEDMTISGVLDYATGRNKKNEIGITDKSGKEWAIKVPAGMEDVVKHHFLKEVSLTGPYDGKYITIDDIEKIEETNL